MNPISRMAIGLGANARALLAKPYTQLLVATDFAGWSLDEDTRELVAISKKLGITAYRAHRPLSRLEQCVHYSSFFSLEDPRVFKGKHRVSVDYYHGKPEQDPAFRAVFDTIKKHANALHRVRISYSGMLPVAENAGVPRDRIHLIPIAVNRGYFQPQTRERKISQREILGIPQSSVVIGSFQKDGQGWGEGLEPKWVKGPDVLLRTLKQLKEKIPELYVLLTGPARGYVKSGLEKAGIPYRHVLLEHYADLGKFYQALDLYLVTSREEGGPKAVLESMASGIPLVTTKVGQAMDLVRHRENGMMAEVEDADAIASFALQVLNETALSKKIIENGLLTAAANTYESQLPLWKKYFTGYLNF